MKRAALGLASLGAMVSALTAGSLFGGARPKKELRPKAKWHDVRTFKDGVHLVRGFTKTKPHYRVSAEQKRRAFANAARMIERRHRKSRKAPMRKMPKGFWPPNAYKQQHSQDGIML